MAKTLSGLDLSGTTHTNAGFYKDDAWTFTDVTGNYNNTSGKVDDNIGKADAVCMVTPYDVTYDGSAHTATGTCLGRQWQALERPRPQRHHAHQRRLLHRTTPGRSPM